MPPLVSIICLSYNHKPYIKEALDSIFKQTYQNIEVIVVDDASTDGSAEVIIEYLKSHPEIEFIQLEQNIGNCKAFNFALKRAKGDYIIDFALDDVLLSSRIERQIEVFEKLPKKYGVVFSDVSLIDENSQLLRNHYNRDKDGKLIERVPQGDVYQDLVERYFINPVSMMVRREVFEGLRGYDETLAYEDFDFWVRSSRQFLYHFIDEVQTLKRMVPGSHGSKFDQKREHKMLESTLKVCEKAFRLNKNEEENKALAKRIRYHLRQAFFTENFSLVNDFYILLTKVSNVLYKDRFWLFLARLRIPLHWAYKTRK